MKKIKLNFIALATVVLGTVIFISCSGEENAVTSDNSALFKTVSPPENLANPMDSVGVIHNEILRKVLDNKDVLETTDDYISYAREVFLSDYDFPNKEEDLLSNQQIKDVLSDEENDYSNVIENSNHTESSKVFIKDFISILIDFSEEENLDYEEVRASIIEFENFILSNTELSYDEKMSILKITSVGRHSSYFWYNEFINSKGVSQKRKWWKWVVVAICDVAGGVAGATIGSPTGIAAVGGAIAGAASASAGGSTLVDWVAPD